MAISLVLTVIGEDKPGLVEALSRTVTANGANWLESRMSHMAGKFAGIVRVSVPEENADALGRALAGLEGEGLKVVAEPGVAEDPGRGFAPLTLELVGTDHPGIVRDISRVLARRGINVEELITECTAAPMSGERLFRATAQLRLPANVTVDELQRDLEEVAQSLMVDVSLAGVKTGHQN